MSSFRRFGGLNFSSNNNIVKSNISNANKLNITNKTGLPNSKQIFASHIDLSGNSILHTGTIYFQDGTSMSSSSSGGGSGTQGPQGAQGYTGAPGEQGATGPAGSGDNYWTLNNTTLSNTNNVTNVSITGNTASNYLLYIDGTLVPTTDLSTASTSSTPVFKVQLCSSNFLIYQDTNSTSTVIANSGSNNTIICGGNFTATGNITAGSDYRIKKDITPLNTATYSVDNLNPVQFKFKQSDKESIGLIAHELQEHFPFLVEGTKDGKEIQSVNYIGLIGVLIKEIQELKHRVAKLESNVV